MRPYASPPYNVCICPGSHSGSATHMAGFYKYSSLAVCQFFRNILPGHATLYHQHHGMIQEIRHLILDLLWIWILGCDHQLRTLFTYFFQNFINSFIKQVIGVRTFLRMLFSVFDDLYTFSKTSNGFTLLNSFFTRSL